MNLADAIRKAAVGQPSSPNEPLLIAERQVEPRKAEVVELPMAEPSSHDHEVAIPTTDSATTVRLELTLTPDQLQSLFRTVMNTQRSILTIREAASYLRLTTATLEKMAEEHTIPAFKLDGRWRFSRLALQDWLNLSLGDQRSG
jgi:excisionase family DNA binding protein